MTGTGPTPDRLRLDKWLWQARFFKSRRLAADAAGSGTVRINGDRISKAAHAVRPGDVLTFPQGCAVRVVRVHALGTRRGPATEARALYEDLAPAAPSPDPAEADATQTEPPRREPGAGRPTKRERRDIEALRGRVRSGSP